MRKSILLLLSVLFFYSCGIEEAEKLSTNHLNLTPHPQYISLKGGELDITKGFGFTTNLTDTFSVGLEEYLNEWIAFSKDASKQLQVIVNPKFSSNKEGYLLLINNSGITIKASGFGGAFYGVQTLSQLLEYNSNNGTTLPHVEIEDQPRFAYRGFMLDVSRHFFPLDFVKKQIDLMAHYKLNTFHWHLTDGPGWRLEIEKYPELTNIAAWRTHETWKEWWVTSPRKYVKEGSDGAYGGYYTQKEARELIEYAAKRNITVIPEIEMPGHSEEVLAVYPQLSCTGKAYTSSEYCIGNEETFTFLENVLDEVIDIFPSEYIHIGGDEASREHWQDCSKCQAHIKDEGLKDENELQSYLIKRIEKYLNSKGRRLLGWDEILVGGLAPDATVMSWRGEEGGIEAVKSGHQTIMTPGEFCYFDSYQANPDTQPEAIGGFLPLEKVYSYNPVPDDLTAAEAHRILGVQANLWAEYIPTTDHVEHMVWPRLIALSEVAWTQPEQKDWGNFKIRANKAIEVLQRKGYNSFTLSDEVAFSHDLDEEKGLIMVSLSTEKAPAEIRYTKDGVNPSRASYLYKGSIAVDDSLDITAQVFQNGEAIGEAVSRRFDYHRGIGKEIAYNIPINKYYPAAGENALIDGLNGGLSHSDGRWQGFLKGVDVTIDMGEVTTLNSINARFKQSVGPHIWFPEYVKISVSDDNENFTTIKDTQNTISREKRGTIFETFGWQGDIEARYIRYEAPAIDVKGGAWVFVDEITIW
ncbi:MAG: family 20 glycosylhydrolase [Bacteroidales bacterium]|nr:family 20 glycosylhydrolase [Bacteroidales bacterium]